MNLYKKEPETSELESVTTLVPEVGSVADLIDYLIDQQKILYFSINNVTGFKNVNGYQYADMPNMNGDFARRTLRPAADQFFFVGFFDVPPLLFESAVA